MQHTIELLQTTLDFTINDKERLEVLRLIPRDTTYPILEIYVQMATNSSGHPTWEIGHWEHPNPRRPACTAPKPT
jgi:hypothetical protein